MAQINAVYPDPPYYRIEYDHVNQINAAPEPSLHVCTAKQYLSNEQTYDFIETPQIIQVLSLLSGSHLNDNSLHEFINMVAQYGPLFTRLACMDKTVPPGFKAASDASVKNSCNNSYQPNCIPGLPNYTNQSNTVKRISKVVKRAFVDEQSPLQFYEMLGVQYAKNKAEKANVKSDTQADKNDFANCESLYQNEKSKAYYVSSNADYLYPLRRDCNRKQAIVSPDLYNPILEAFSNHQSPGNSAISCHVNAIYTQPKALFTGAQKEIFSDFSFTPQNFGIPEYLIEVAVGK
jgi:hypothetical protein